MSRERHRIRGSSGRSSSEREIEKRQTGNGWGENSGWENSEQDSDLEESGFEPFDKRTRRRKRNFLFPMIGRERRPGRPTRSRRRSRSLLDFFSSVFGGRNSKLLLVILGIIILSVVVLLIARYTPIFSNLAAFVQTLFEQFIKILIYSAIIWFLVEQFLGKYLGRLSGIRLYALIVVGIFLLFVVPDLGTIYCTILITIIAIKIIISAISGRG